jgi:hypothetical protein
LRQELGEGGEIRLVKKQLLTYLRKKISVYSGSPCYSQFHQHLRLHFSYKILAPKLKRNLKSCQKGRSYEKSKRKNVDEIYGKSRKRSKKRKTRNHCICQQRALFFGTQGSFLSQHCNYFENGLHKRHVTINLKLGDITRVDCIFLQSIVTTNVCSATKMVSRETVNVTKANQSQIKNYFYFHD